MAKDWPADLDRREAAASEGAVVIEHPARLNPPAPIKFDPIATWARLTPECQARIGAAAVTLAYASRASLEVDGDRAIGFEAAEIEAARAIQAALPPITIRAGHPLPLPDLVALGVLACRSCGCTDAVACRGSLGETCYWAEPDLCSACQARQAQRQMGIRRW